MGLETQEISDSSITYGMELNGVGNSGNFRQVPLLMEWN